MYAVCARKSYKRNIKLSKSALSKGKSFVKEICASETYKFEGIDLQINHFFSRKSSLLNISLIKCILTFLSGFLGDTVKDWMLHNRS